MRVTVLGWVPIWAVLACGARQAEAASIVVDGQPKARIVLPAHPTPTERFAADELAGYLEQISGARLPVETEPAAATNRPGRPLVVTRFIGSGQGGVAMDRMNAVTTNRPSESGARILIGATSAAKGEMAVLAAGDPEAFLVKRLAGDLLLVGASDRATLYAVYDFLEDELGCRWLGPGPDWECVPRRATIAMPDVNRHESPAMKYRFLRMTTAQSTTWSRYNLSWAVKQKINIGSGWPPEELPEAIASRGGFRAWMGPHLLIPNVLPPEKYFAEHPEWYALVDGRRRMLPKDRTQLCTTNPEVAEMVARGLGRIFDARPEMDFVGMGQADGVAFCECERCRALDGGETWSSGQTQRPVITRRWLSFVGAVSRRLAQTHPGKKVFTLAYHQTFRPPDPAVSFTKPEANVMIEVVNSRPNYVCFVHRFEDPGCPHHVAFCDGLRRWLSMTPGGVMVYEYDPHSTFCTMPYPAAYKFIDDIKYLARAGVIGYEGQSGPTTWGTYGINHYVIAKTTWDPTVDAQELVCDYCEHAFGDASAAMLGFLKTIDRGLVSANHVTDGIWTYMTPEVMAAARRQLDEAHARANDAAVKKRLSAYEVGFHYGELGSQAWRTAQQALAEHDADKLALAIELAEQAAQYCLEEQNKDAHFAAAPGKLITVHLRSWQRELDRLRKAAK